MCFIHTTNHLLDIEHARTTSGTGIEIRLRGEADLANGDHLRSHLDAVDLHGCTAVDVDLSQLTFCDVTGHRELGAYASRLGQHGCTLSVRGAAPTFMKVAGLLGCSLSLATQPHTSAPALS